MDSEKRTWQFILTLMVAFITLELGMDFFMRIQQAEYLATGLHIVDQVTVNVAMEVRGHIFFFRMGLVLALLTLGWMQAPAAQARKTTVAWVACALAAIAIFLNGYATISLYNRAIYPVAWLSMYVAVPMAMTGMRASGAVDNQYMDKLPSKKGKCAFVYRTKKGVLCLADARTATFIEGTAKAGKTASLILPTIVQAVKKGFAGLIYDYEGDLAEQGGGVLSRTAYSAIKKYATPVKFALINFTNLERTIRCNPLAAQYIKSYNHAREMATVIMYNINRSWSHQRDFWAENAIAAYAATIWFFSRNNTRLCTIPHVTEFLLHDFRKVLTILQTDADVAPYIRPILTAMERDAAGQIAGAEASTQFPLAKMRSPEVYYVLNPIPGQALDLDITNKDKPVMLSVCNSPELQNALAPAIGAIIQACKNQMNKLGKQQSLFLFDEMPTIYIDKADKIPAEARKKDICTFFAVQTYDQLVRDYGIHNARVIRNACGNLFTGITSIESAEMMSKMIGDHQHTEVSMTKSASGMSVTKAMKERRLLKTSTIAAQQTGHFTGRILGGKPPYFSAQFNFKQYPAEEIPGFNWPVEVGDRQLQQEILAATVQENYERIKKEIINFMDDYEYLYDD